MIKKVEKEASTTAGIKGAMGPLGMVKRNKKNKNNVSKPYNEPELFENAVMEALLNDESIEEAVKKRGNQWVVMDDDTGSQLGSYQEREQAWEKQRQVRSAKKSQKKSQDSAAKTRHTKSKKAEAPKIKDKVEKAPKAKKAPKPKVTKEELVKKMMQLVTEGNMISYVFEQNPISDQSLIWDQFMSKLSKETVLSDAKLKNILKNIAKTEAKMLGSAVDSVKKTLEQTGQFTVDGKALSQDAAGDVVISFSVTMKDDGKKLNFGIKIENGKPLLLFPDETREMLNVLATDSAKLLRAELMHCQETVLDLMDDVYQAMLKRDEYLKTIAGKLSNTISSMGPLQVSLLKYILKKQFKGVK